MQAKQLHTVAMRNRENREEWGHLAASLNWILHGRNAIQGVPEYDVSKALAGYSDDFAL